MPVRALAVLLCLTAAESFTVNSHRGMKARPSSQGPSSPQLATVQHHQAICGLTLIGGWALAIDHSVHLTGVTSPAHLTICVLVALYVLFAEPVADTPAPWTGSRQSRGGGDVSMCAMGDSLGDTECYVIDGVVMDGEQVILCTSEPEEAAWDWGVHPNALKAARTGDMDREQCEETVSFNGTPEWLCTSSGDTVA